jgi:hypothetical protein
MNEFSVWVGIDWGSREHQVCVLDGTGKVVRELVVPHEAAALGALADALVELGGGPERVAVAIERPHGPVVDLLLERLTVVFAINPKQLDRFRDRHTVAGAKDDRRDAYVLADSLRTDTQLYRRVKLREPRLIELSELTRIREQLGEELNVLGNRLYDQLLRYWPRMLDLGSPHEDPWLWELLELAPDPQRAKHLARPKVSGLLRRHRIRRVDADQVMAALRAQPLHVAPGVAQACTRHIGLLLSRLRLTHSQRHQCDRDIELLLEELGAPDEKKEHRDAAVVRSWPGLGPINCATMLSEAAELLENRDYTRLRAQAGIAPVTRQTGLQGKRRGKHPVVLMRQACNHRLRQTVRHWARSAVRHDPRSREQFQRLRASGHGYERALRGVADRLLAALCASLRTRTLYDPRRRRAAAGAAAALEPPRRARVADAVTAAGPTECAT